MLRPLSVRRRSALTPLLGLSATLLATLLVLSGCSSRDESGKTAATGQADQVPPLAIHHEGQPPNLILLSLDTTRRDYLSCYGFDGKITPNLDRLAKEGILFEDPYTPVPITLPAHATMLTGLYPFQHGVRNNGAFVLDDRYVTLTELLKDKGFQTAAVLGAFPLDERFGLGQGFDFYDDDFPPESSEREGDLTQRLAAEVTGRALQWLDGPDRNRERPFFLFVHYYDPHAPYHPPAPFDERFADEPYCGEIAYTDAAVGELLDGLRSRKLMNETVILATGDHGEGLGEHGEPTHTIYIYGSTQRVPLIIRFPEAGPFRDDSWRDRRIGGTVNLVDLLPTAWEALGYSAADLPEVAGTSLMPAIQQGAGGHEWIYHESLVPALEYGAAELRCLQAGHWKYIRAPRPELYDLQEDPDELRNLADQHEDRIQEMEARLAELLASEASPDSQVAMDQETIDKLRSLGYIAGGGRRDRTGPQMDPKDLRDIPMTIARVQTLAAHHRTETALVVIDSLLAEHPHIPTAQQLQCTYLIRLERGEDALAATERALADCRGCPDETTLLMQRANAHLLLGNLGEAMSQARVVQETHPEEPELHNLLGQIMQMNGNLDGARQAFLKEAELFPDDPRPWIRLGHLEQNRNRPTDAEAAYRKALKIRPHDPEAKIMLSVLLTAVGRQQEADTLVDEVLQTHSSFPGAHFRKALSLRRNGKFDQAIQHLRIALAIEPRNPLLLTHLGTLYADMGENDLAIQSLEAALATGQATPENFVNVGLFYAKLGRFQEAIDRWERGIAVDPNSQVVESMQKYIGMARQQMQQGQQKP